MYKVLLVDDEPEVILAVIKKMEWERLGFEVIGYAQNGEEALEMAEGGMIPDVVMTDIKMPFMDGLTLSRRLKEIYAGVKIIIFSGFDEFEYAREAIKIEVEEYILKPMKLEELTQVFVRIKNLLDKERDEKVNINKLKEYYINSLPIMQDQFYIGLIEGRMDENQIQQFKKNYQIQMSGTSFVVTVFLIEDKKEKSNENAEMEQALKKLSVKHILDENLVPYSFKSLLYLEQIIHITMLEDDEDIKRYVDSADRICKMAERMTQTSVVAGIGRISERLSSIKFSYEGAKTAAFYRGCGEASHAVYIEEILPAMNESVSYDEQNIQGILREIKMGDKVNLSEQVDQFITQVKDRKLSIRQIQIILMGIITELYKLAGSYEVDITEIFGENLDVYQMVLRFDSLEEVQRWIMETCLLVRRSISKERKNTTQLLIDKAVQYIENNFNDCTLSIEKICNELNVSSAYFSTIFKKETGKTCLNYLTDIRMEKAILLLDGTEEKTYIISEKVGYSEPNYFSYVFKKKYGMAPSKYRRIRLEQNDSQE